MFHERPAINDSTGIQASLTMGRDDRLDALADYLAALPWPPADAFELCTLVMHDLNYLIERNLRGESPV